MGGVILRKINNNCNNNSLFMKKKENLSGKSNETEDGKSMNCTFTSSEYSRHLNCKLCLNLMVKPRRLHPCGHSFCQLCIDPQNKKIKKCPICSTKIQHNQQDLLVYKLVGQLSVKCINQGCPFQGTFQQYRQFHAKNCKLSKGIDQWLENINQIISQPQKRMFQDEKPFLEDNKDFLKRKQLQIVDHNDDDFTKQLFHKTFKKERFSAKQEVRQQQVKSQQKDNKQDSVFFLREQKEQQQKINEKVKEKQQ